MQTTGGFHDHVIESLSHVAENISHDAKDFDTANTVLYTDALFRDLSVCSFCSAVNSFPYHAFYLHRFHSKL